jgi:hypothetical protein
MTALSTAINHHQSIAYGRTATLASKINTCKFISQNMVLWAGLLSVARTPRYGRKSPISPCGDDHLLHTAWSNPEESSPLLKAYSK